VRTGHIAAPRRRTGYGRARFWRSTQPVSALGLLHSLRPGAYINGTPAEVLYSGAMLTLVGMNQVNLQVDPLTPASKAASLELRVDGVPSNLYRSAWLTSRTVRHLNAGHGG